MNLHLQLSNDLARPARHLILSLSAICLLICLFVIMALLATTTNPVYATHTVTLVP